MAKIVETSDPGGFPDGPLSPSHRMLRLDCGHSVISATVTGDVTGLGWACPWLGCWGNPETRCNCGIIGDYPYEHASTCPKRPTSKIDLTESSPRPETEASNT